MVITRDNTGKIINMIEDIPTIIWHWRRGVEPFSRTRLQSCEHLGVVQCSACTTCAALESIAPAHTHRHVYEVHVHDVVRNLLYFAPAGEYPQAFRHIGFLEDWEVTFSKPETDFSRRRCFY